MFCVGARITFADGRAAAARNADEFAKVIDIGQPTALNCYADSISLNITIKENGGAKFSWANKDTKESFGFDTDEAVDLKTVVPRFLKTGERYTGFDWKSE